MNKMNQFLRSACTVIVAALMAGCAAFLALRAVGFVLPWLPVYAVAAGAALLVELGRKGMLWGVGAAVGLTGGLGALLAGFLPEIRQTIAKLGQTPAAEILLEHPAAGLGAALMLALLLGALFDFLLRSPGSAALALMVLLVAVICALAVNEKLNLWIALPGLIAGVAAFGLPLDVRREGVRPLLLVPAAVLAVLALALVPANRTTWAPLENLATRIRSVVEDYIRFTEERIAFSINEKGYDRAGMIGDNVVAMLGGPADPDDAPVMRVQTGENLLLRGAIKGSYTGYSWVDELTKARYLYYDFTHRGVRGEVFDSDTTTRLPGFAEHTASIEMLEEGTSTLFVPAQMADFSMNLADAVYYNSAGEVFLTRKVVPGDQYSVTARLPQSDEALIAAAAKREGQADPRFDEMRALYTALPEGIDSRVYALAVELTQQTNNGAQKALNIQNHLARNYRYTLDGGVPADGQDFVSWFLLESKEGYCSYYASAMTVLCRIAGLPARYVEGYSVHANPGGETIVTGENAHAWVEVYINGLGWVAFDPTARSLDEQGQNQGEEPPQGREHGHETGQDETPFENDDIANDPTPTPSPTPDSGDADVMDDPTPPPEGGDPTPTPTPEPDGNGFDQPTPTPEPDPASQPHQTPPPPQLPDEEDKPNLTWLWILLAILLLAALIALAVLWLKKRLRDTDPLRLAAAATTTQLAAAVLYRAMLNLLMQLGQVPTRGETPQAFAARVAQAMNNPAYAAFVSAVVRGFYSGREIPQETILDGCKAYLNFLNGLRRGERIRFHLRRALKGLGSFEMIP